tara:strand:+ start:853 stop:4635 length:3783 start_codon:yes stop_codon:yes gene_type:complete
MAAILDPKTRFFDTFLTKEGRRQLASGDLRMRYVSFSDGATTYDDAGDNVIHDKDGSVFFEAMSKPQDQIIHEAPSIVNMMSIRDPVSQPVFLNDGNNNRIQAAMFGDQVISPPDGRLISASFTAGVDRVNVKLDLNSNFYVSGSRTQEIQYKSQENLRGWWVFEDKMDQIESAGLTFKKENILKITSDSNGTTPIQTEISGVNRFFFRTGGEDNFVFLNDLNIFRGIKKGDRFSYGAFIGIVGDSFQVADAGFIVLNVKDGGFPGSAQQVIDDQVVGLVGNNLLSGYKVSENLKRNSSLATNAAYVKKTGDLIVNDSNPTFNDTHLMHVSSKVNKSWTGGNDKAIRISLEGQFYGVNNFPRKSTNSEEFHSFPVKSGYNYVTGGEVGYNRLGNQISVNFYLNNPGAGKTETIFCVYGHDDQSVTKSVFERRMYLRVYSIDNDVFLKIEKTNATVSNKILQIPGDNVIKAQNWHRLSLAWNKNYISLVLDGDMSKSVTAPTNFHTLRGNATLNHGSIDHGYLLFSQADGTTAIQSLDLAVHNIPNSPIELFLGNQPVSVFNETDFSFVSNTYLDGYIQSCEYYIDEINDEDMEKGYKTGNQSSNGKGKVGNMNLPVFNNSDNFSNYFKYKFDLNRENIVSLLQEENKARAQVTFAYAFDNKYTDPIDPFTINLTDANGFSVTFKAATSIVGGATGTAKKISSSLYEFLVPDYTQAGSKNSEKSKTDLARNLESAILLAKSEGDLNIDPQIDGQIRNQVDLVQRNAGSSGNTSIVVNLDDEESIFKQDFIGGESNGYLVRNNWSGRDKAPLTSDSTYQNRNGASNSSTYDEFFGLKIDADVSKREWVNYHSIQGESSIFFASISGSIYQKEEKLSRENLILSFPDLVNSVSSILSGSINSYKDLILLGHLDLNKSDENQGFEVSRHRQKIIQSEDNLPIMVQDGEKYGEESTTLFKSRFEQFQFIEHVYGQHVDYFEQVPLVTDMADSSPVSGLFFEKESTLLNIEEIIDNDFDDDENTRSSTRLPNFFILPPISNKNFVFDNPDWKEESGNPIPWRKNLNDLLGEEQSGEKFNISEYVKNYDEEYHGIIPNETINSFHENSSIISIDADSNKDIIKYLDRNQNVDTINKINCSLASFNESLTFEKTSFNQNTFVQMFELSADSGRPTFKKLAIRDLGIFYKPKETNFEVSEIEFNGTPANDVDQRPMGDITVTGPAIRSGDKLVHAFVFGKIIREKQDSDIPGTGIYFMPIFYFEAEIGE